MRDYKPQAEKNAAEKLLQAFAQTRFGGMLFIRVFPGIDRRLLPLTRGKLSTGLGQPIVLLHHGRRRPMRARVTQGEERARLWAMACDNYSGPVRYQERAGDRVIPVIALEPR
jgi:hypothetical protein